MNTHRSQQIAALHSWEDMSATDARPLPEPAASGSGRLKSCGRRARGRQKATSPAKASTTSTRWWAARTSLASPPSSSLAADQSRSATTSVLVSCPPEIFERIATVCAPGDIGASRNCHPSKTLGWGPPVMQVSKIGPLSERLTNPADVAVAENAEAALEEAPLDPVSLDVLRTQETDQSLGHCQAYHLLHGRHLLCGEGATGRASHRKTRQTVPR